MIDDATTAERVARSLRVLLRATGRALSRALGPIVLVLTALVMIGIAAAVLAPERLLVEALAPVVSGLAVLAALGAVALALRSARARRAVTDPAAATAPGIAAPKAESPVWLAAREAAAALGATASSLEVQRSSVWFAATVRDVPARVGFAEVGANGALLRTFVVLDLEGAQPEFTLRPESLVDRVGAHVGLVRDASVADRGWDERVVVDAEPDLARFVLDDATRASLSAIRDAAGSRSDVRVRVDREGVVLEHVRGTNTAGWVFRPGVTGEPMTPLEALLEVALRVRERLLEYTRMQAAGSAPRAVFRGAGDAAVAARAPNTNDAGAPGANPREAPRSSTSDDAPTSRVRVEPCPTEHAPDRASDDATESAAEPMGRARQGDPR